MTTKIACEQYKHTIRSAYRSLQLVSDFNDSALGLIDFSEISTFTQELLLQYCFERIKFRLQNIDKSLVAELLEQPSVRYIHFLNHELVIPIINNQGVEWYGSSPLSNFDFMIETFHGMHRNARTIYDVGGHHGVWAGYYSIIVGRQGRVYTFEPSILNIEVMSLLFLINSIDNVVCIPFAIGDSSGIVKKNDTNILVDYIDHNIGIIRFDQIFWERADFIKIDIEGFEYELLKSFGDLFQFCCNIHLELHIPHLSSRGINYKEVYCLIPFDIVDVFNYQNGSLKHLGPNDELIGFCSLLITPRRQGVCCLSEIE